MQASTSWDDVAFSSSERDRHLGIRPVSQLNTRPVVSPVNASRLPSRTEPRASLGVGAVGYSLPREGLAPPVLCQLCLAHSHMGHKRTNRRRPKFKFVRCCPKADKISALRRPRQAGPPLQPRSATMQDNANSELPAPKHIPWKKGKLTGAKPPLRQKHVWAIRTKLQIEKRTRDLASVSYTHLTLP